MSDVMRTRERRRLGVITTALVVAAATGLAYPAAGSSAEPTSVRSTGVLLDTRGEPDPAGVAKVRCVEKGTSYGIQLTGLNPKAVYTVWGIVFTDTPNGFAVGSLGAPDGSQNVFSASSSGTAQFNLLVRPGGPLSFGVLAVPGFDDPGVWPQCMIGKGLLIIDGHTDDLSHGGVPGSGYPENAFADSYDLMQFEL